MPGQSFIPNRDAELLTWAQSASGFITSAPTSYGLTSLIASGFASAVSAYQTALDAVQPGVRNQMAVSTKNSLKLALKNNIRLWSKIVDGTATVTNAQRLQLGLNVRALPSPVPAPGSAPGITIVSASARTVRLRLHDTAAEGRRGRPKGTLGAALYSYVGPTAPTDPKAWHPEGTVSKVLVDVTFDPSTPNGALVWFTAAWIGTRMETGPGTIPVSTNIPGGAALVG